MSGISLYMSYSVNATPSFLRMNISTYDPPYPGGLRVVSEKTFEDQEVPLDTVVCYLKTLRLEVAVCSASH
jgi:hypothetical protein